MKRRGKRRSERENEEGQKSKRSYEKRKRKGREGEITGRRDKRMKKEERDKRRERGTAPSTKFDCVTSHWIGREKDDRQTLLWARRGGVGVVVNSLAVKVEKLGISVALMATLYTRVSGY